ncbi:hypothetical protein BDN72DRAFT_884196 [Pluteus cervinus]|uniref:Uncharacterized protein n=1 Tax=Pluteus cervinus TaxID=181527 RepID=A0ACD2ZZ04_9AGAR|nr:hypothetical protein BDN72DRAFT_884196 [Pluteus cervinus]
MIVMNLCDDQVVYVAQAKTASDMWKSLLDAYDAETHPSMPLLRLKLYKSLLEEGGDIVKHHAELKALRRRLHLIGYLIPEEDFRWIVLASLPESWSAFCHSIPVERSTTAGVVIEGCRTVNGLNETRGRTLELVIRCGVWYETSRKVH